MRRCCLLLLMFTFALCAGVSAQTDDSTWPIVERCFGDATAPPNGWTFDGTLLMTSPGRLHAFRQEWETPHIVVFSRDIPNSPIPHSGVLSPDGSWYAVIDGLSFEGQVGIRWKTNAIVVYSTKTSQNYSMVWNSEFYAIRHLLGHKLFWLDNQHLLYQKAELNGGGDWFVINPFNQSVEQWKQWDLSGNDDILAPDGSAVLSEYWMYVSFSDNNGWILSRPEGNIQLPIWGTPAWRPDSQVFAAYTKATEAQRADQLVIFDLNGNITESVFSVSERVIPDSRFTKWSPDAHYLLFEADHLYIANLESQQIIDTCVQVQGLRSAVWSPSNAQFALITFERDDGIQIFDLNTWGRYVVGYHSGAVIGWRADD